MILKKPYAFIIRHFRMIHLMLLIPMCYLVFKTGAIVRFFRVYVSNGYMLSSDMMLSNLTSNYINIFMYIAVILILLILIILSLVLQKKSKPTKFYNISILYYLAMFLLITGCFVVFGMIENDTLDNTFARILRDLSLLIHYSQYIFIVYVLMRGVGFNIKQFNFKDDLEDLQISAEDSEEFEFLVGRDTYKTKRNIRRFFRELKYYYKENKFIFTIIFIVAIGVIGTMLFMNREVYQKVYNNGDTVSFGFLNMKVEDSYISDLNLKGQVIKDGKTYVIVKFKLTNRFRDDKVFNYANIQLVVNSLRVSPDMVASNNFADLGNPYGGGQIKGNTEGTYIMAYEIDSSLIHGGKYEIEAYSGFDSSQGGIGVINKRFKLNPKVVDSEIISNDFNMGTVIKLDNTNLNKSEVSLNSYEFMGRFSYNENYCLSKNNCYDVVRDLYLNGNEVDKNTLMVMDYSLNLDTDSLYMSYSNKTFKNFFDDFMIIKYKIQDKEYTRNVSIINPVNYSDKLVFKIDRDILNADSISAVIAIRNRAFNIKLK